MSEELPLARDTSLLAERMQFAIWRRMTPSEKFAAFLDLQQTAIDLAEAGIRLRHPQADAREVFRCSWFLRRVARRLDRVTMLRCYGWDPDAHA